MRRYSFALNAAVYPAHYVFRELNARHNTVGAPNAIGVRTIALVIIVTAVMPAVNA